MSENKKPEGFGQTALSPEFKEGQASFGSETKAESFKQMCAGE